MELLYIVKALYNTLYFNFKAFPFKEAVRFPIICGATICFGKIEKSKIHFRNGIAFKRMTVGMSEGSFRSGHKQRTYIHIGKNANLIIADKLDIPCGSVLNVNGRVEFGKGFMPNCFLTISCENHISIGNYCNIGWNVTIIDGDGHPLCCLQSPYKQINPSRPIMIGNNCWIAAHVTIMKGVSLSDHTTIPYGSIITKSCETPNVIYGGNPNTIIKGNIARQDFYK